MVNCSHCGKEIKRLVFCSPSHKVMYHRRVVGPQETLSSKEVKNVVKVLKKNKVEPVDGMFTITADGIKNARAIDYQIKKQIKVCKHGSMIGLCKFRCTKVV